MVAPGSPYISGSLSTPKGTSRMFWSRPLGAQGRGEQVRPDIGRYHQGQSGQEDPHFAEGQVGPCRKPGHRHRDQHGKTGHSDNEKGSAAQGGCGSRPKQQIPRLVRGAHAADQKIGDWDKHRRSHQQGGSEKRGRGQGQPAAHPRRQGGGAPTLGETQRGADCHQLLCR